ncbi:MAG: branched-chain amino acid ABC transporter permease [Pseudomonadota bacterium]
MIGQIIVSGILTGLLYALIAFGFQLTYATSKTANFGQGSLVMLGGLLTAIIAPKFGYIAALPVIMIACAVLGVMINYLCIRPSLRNTESANSWIVATIAFGIILIGAQEMIFGKNELSIATPFSEDPLSFGNINILPHEGFIALLVLTITFLLDRFYHSRWGKAFEAVSYDRYAAQLQGIPAEKIILGSYIASSILAGIAGWAVSPITGAGITLEMLGIKSFCAAVVGSLSSTRGALLAGALIGVLENLAAFLLPSGFRALPALILCALVITFRPTGLFGKATINKV